MEQCVGWLKECRRVGTRFDTLAGSFLSFMKLAIIQRYLRVLDPSDRASQVGGKSTTCWWIFRHSSVASRHEMEALHGSP